MYLIHFYLLPFTIYIKWIKLKSTWNVSFLLNVEKLELLDSVQMILNPTVRQLWKGGEEKRKRRVKRSRIHKEEEIRKEKAHDRIKGASEEERKKENVCNKQLLLQLLTARDSWFVASGFAPASQTISTSSVSHTPPKANTLHVYTIRGSSSSQRCTNAPQQSEKSFCNSLVEDKNSVFVQFVYIHLLSSTRHILVFPTGARHSAVLCCSLVEGI